MEARSPELGEFERYGDETLVVDADRQVVVVTRALVPWSAEEIEHEQAARNAIAIRDMADAVQQHMDRIAAERNYDGIQSAALRAALPNSPFHTEGVAYGEWMDACWSHCYQVMADVQGGLREQPSTEELIAELPELVLPV
ncbi:hypothetical protein [Stutzerimonas zhaodongensis]|uniref:hypothetical protein n=1 Tax=Stutzerimonas zhaodongensis TaxID=1176257 RepID=UPI001F4EBCE4|nr:hypothetical protein [Stutzerimonas zhaodongensis]UNG19241.1 hypothetical protein MKP10_02980 [Stutzerimonas zhaodongensis]